MAFSYKTVIIDALINNGRIKISFVKYYYTIMYLRF